jgi:hypothetical protein
MQVNNGEIIMHAQGGPSSRIIDNDPDVLDTPQRLSLEDVLEGNKLDRLSTIFAGSTRDVWVSTWIYMVRRGSIDALASMLHWVSKRKLPDSATERAFEYFSDVVEACKHDSAFAQEMAMRRALHPRTKAFYRQRELIQARRQIQVCLKLGNVSSTPS